MNMSNRLTDASKIVRKNALYAGSMGLIPIPLADMAAIAAMQVMMMKELCELYGLEFKTERAKAILTSLVGGVTAGTLATGLPGSLIKSIPGIGSIIGFLSMPAFAAAVTYGIGNALIPHFELGGTLNTLDPASPETQQAYAAGLKSRKMSVQAT
jgi:uncharacterized protein (DUF697 family)